MSWLEDRDVELEEPFEGWVTVRFTYCKRLLFEDVEVVFPAHVDPVPVVDEGSFASVLAVGRGTEGGGIVDVLIDIGEVRDFGSKGGCCSLSLLDSENKERDIDLGGCISTGTGLDETADSDVPDEHFVSNALSPVCASDHSGSEADLSIV